MSPPRMGEMLKRIVRLSDLDLEEILQEQSANPRRFGEVALSLGLCTPMDVWRAWYGQLAVHTPRIDLGEFGVDSQAVDQVSREIATQYRLIPLRVFGNQIVAAISEDAPMPATSELAMRLKKEIRFVLAPAWQIDLAISAHYGALRSSA
jgi:type IV pilus assembly protein PilB